MAGRMPALQARRRAALVEMICPVSQGTIPVLGPNATTCVGAVLPGGGQGGLQVGGVGGGEGLFEGEGDDDGGGDFAGEGVGG